MPDMKFHNQFEQKIADWLDGQGFSTFQVPYHEYMDEMTSRVLASRWSPTALYLRGRADRVAIHRSLPVEFEWEAKTHENAKYQDITLEVLPLIYHRIKAEMGVKCLYVCLDRHLQRQNGFWVHELPFIRTVYLPSRNRDISLTEYYKAIIESHFPSRLKETGPTGGSGDPYAVISAQVARNLPHWQSLVEKLLAEFRAVPQ